MRTILHLWIYVLIVGLFPIGVCAAADIDMKVHRFKSADGTYLRGVNAILQDDRGYLWLATEYGLFLYDGYRCKAMFSDFRGEFNLNGIWITALALDTNGCILIGLNEGILLRYDPVGEILDSIDLGKNRLDGLEFYTINVIRPGPCGVIWLGTRGAGLVKLTPVKGMEPPYNKPAYTTTQYIEKDGLCHLSVYSLALGPGNTVWIATEQGLNHLHTDTGLIKRYNHVPGNPQTIGNDYVRSLVMDSNNALWVGTGRGLDRIAPGDLPDGLPGSDVTHYTHSGKDSTPLPGDIISSLLEDSRGYLWIGTVNNGLRRLDMGTGEFSVFHHSPGKENTIDGPRILSICEDRSGILWVGTFSGGLNKLSPKKKFKNYTLPQNVGAIAFSESSDKSIWVSGETFGVYRLDRSLPKKGQIRHFPQTPNVQGAFPQAIVYSILRDSDQGMWFGTHREGLVWLKPGTLPEDGFLRYKHVPGSSTSIADDRVVSLFEDGEGDIWCGTKNGPSLLTAANKEKGVFRTYTDCGKHILSIIQDDKGRLWFGLYKEGLVRLDKQSGETVHFEHTRASPNSLSHNTVMALHEDGADNIWIATMGGGLNRLDPSSNTFTVYSVADGLPSNIIWGILGDEMGNIWLSAHKGLVRFTPTTGRCITYDVNDGLQGYEFNMGSFYKNKRTGEMFFGGQKGFNAFYPADIRTNPHVPPIHITEFRLLSRKTLLKTLLKGKKRLELPFDDAIFSFQFSALDFTEPSKNRYAYKMEGLSDNWIFSGADNRRAAFTKLPPGHYTLKIKGSNNDGEWNEEGISLAIYISPPFWRTWWFALLLGLFGLLAGYQLYRTRIKRLAQQLENEKKLDIFLEKFNISVREKEVIRHLIQGKTRSQIEEALFISSHTVKNHTYRIYRKLGIKNKTELVALFKKSKLILP
ncbi:MAG: hypothetical protein GY765_11870 [bacterium]|nr:hypothetical protein [bacterium]